MIQDNYNNTTDIITKMLYAMIHQIIGLGWLLVPYPVYLLYNKHYLDQKQAQLLIIQTIILFSLMLPGWLKHFVRLIFTGFFVLVVLDLAIIQYEEFVARYEIGDKKRKTKHYKLINGKPIFMVEHHKMLKKLKLQETFILQILIMLWLLLKMHFTKAQYFGINRTLPDSTVFKGFVQTYNGWNCNYPQFTYIPLIYFIILLFSYWFMGKVLANARADEQINSQSYNDVNGYKIYLCKYLMTPALLFITIDFLFNLFAHLSCSGLLECYQFYKNGVLAFLVMCWGVPAAIGLFFYKKVGRFSLQSEHDQSQGSIDLAQLNQQHKQRRLNRSK